MKNYLKEPALNEILLSLNEFLISYNKNMPANFSQVSEEQLLKFKDEHGSLFRNSDKWSLDLHRKKLIDWLPRNTAG